jgi:hypothetical protein
VIDLQSLCWTTTTTTVSCFLLYINKRTDESRNAANRGSVGRPWPAIPFPTRVGFWAWSWPLPWAKSRDCLLSLLWSDDDDEKTLTRERGEEKTVDECDLGWVLSVVIFSSGQSDCWRANDDDETDRPSRATMHQKYYTLPILVRIVRILVAVFNASAHGCACGR